MESLHFVPTLARTASLTQNPDQIGAFHFLQKHLQLSGRRVIRNRTLSLNSTASKAGWRWTEWKWKSW